MKKTYQIAKAIKTAYGWVFVGEKSKVTQELFWDNVEMKTKELTKDQPKKYEETLEGVKTHLLEKDSLTILDSWFKITEE